MIASAPTPLCGILRYRCPSLRRHGGDSAAGGTLPCLAAVAARPRTAVRLRLASWPTGDVAVILAAPAALQRSGDEGVGRLCCKEEKRGGGGRAPRGRRSRRRPARSSERRFERATYGGD